MAAAKAWRHDAPSRLRRGELRAAAHGRARRGRATSGSRAPAAGSIRNRVGRPLQAERHPRLRAALRLRVLPALGGVRLAEVSRATCRTSSTGSSPTGIDAVHDPQHAHAAAGDLPARDRARRGGRQPDAPGSSSPPCGARRDRIAGPDRGRRAARRAARPASGRCGRPRSTPGCVAASCRALRWSDVDLDDGVIRVERAWDAREGEIAPKSRAGGTARADRRRAARRAARAPDALRPRARGSCSAAAPTEPFALRPSTTRARRAWKAAGLDADRPARVPAHLRVADDRRRRQREGALAPTWATPRSRSRSTATAT